MSLCVLQWHEFEYMLYYHMNDMIICPDSLYGCFSCQPNGKSAFWDSTTSSHPTWMFQILVGMSGKQENNLVLWSTILVSYYCHIKWVCTNNNDDPLQCLPIYQHQQLFGNVHKPLLTIYHFPWIGKKSYSAFFTLSNQSGATDFPQPGGPCNK